MIETQKLHVLNKIVRIEVQKEMLWFFKHNITL